MKYYEQKAAMRVYVNAIVERIKDEHLELNFAKVCLEIYSKFPMVGRLAVSKYLEELKEADEGIYFDGKVIRHGA